MASKSITLRLVEKKHPEQTIRLSSLDFGDDILFTLQNKDATAYNLTGKTVKFRMWKFKSGSTIDKTLTVTDAVNGLAKYNIEKSILPESGSWFCNVVSETGTTKRESFEQFFIVFEESPN